ncbi:MAG: hypothetical protein KKA10_17230, partial [Euryarchaeota archaeon]|nr:hypothetical protein [Euryarchaeota archaeon]MCG2737788.1 hypothetical protein [Candidatus Methanoperedenaceae archaeon]
CQRTGIRGRASSRGATLDVCPRRAYVGTKSRSVAFGVGVYTYALRGIGVRGVENPQGFGIDERRFIDSGIQRIFINDHDSDLINSPQRAQSSQRLILPFEFESGKILQQRNGTRMTRIGRIFTDIIDPCVSASTVTPVDCVHTYASARAYVDVYSAQSVFYRSHSRVNNLLSAFISVHPRLINCVGGV